MLEWEFLQSSPYVHFPWAKNQHGWALLCWIMFVMASLALPASAPGALIVMVLPVAVLSIRILASKSFCSLVTLAPPRPTTCLMTSCSVLIIVVFISVWSLSELAPGLSRLCLPGVMLCFGVEVCLGWSSWVCLVRASSSDSFRISCPVFVR